MPIGRIAIAMMVTVLVAVGSLSGAAAVVGVGAAGNVADGHAVGDLQRDAEAVVAGAEVGAGRGDADGDFVHRGPRVSRRTGRTVKPGH